jgi:tetratricopeptide (TPR) repeat protein
VNADAVALVHAASDEAPLSPHAAEAVVTRGAGNPLFLRALTQAARGDEDAAALPDSIENVVAAQIDRLAPSDRDVLRAASVIGMAVDPYVLEALLTDGDAAPAIDWDRLATFVRPAGSGYRFRQALFQSTAYAGLPYRRRAALHSRMADVLASDPATTGNSAVLSLHYFHAGRYDDALSSATAAAAEAAASYANVDAVVLYNRALAAARYVPVVAKADLAQLHEALGDVRARLGEFDAADASFAAARRLCGQGVETIVRLALKSARDAEHLGNYRRALGRVRRVNSVLGDQLDAVPHIRAQLLLRTAWLRFQQGRLHPAHSACEDALALVDEETTPDLVANALHLLDTIEIALGVGSHSTFGERSARALTLYESLGDLSFQARVLNVMGYCAYLNGRWTTALDCYGRSRQLLERTGDSWNAAVASGNIAEIYVDQGRLAEGEAILRPALRVWRASGADNYVTFGQCLLGRIFMRQGRFDEAQTLLSAGLEEFRRQGAMDAYDADAFLAECLVSSGQYIAGLEAARAAIDRSRALAELPAQASLLHRVVGVALDATGDLDGGRKAFDEALRIARERGARHEVVFTLVALIRRAAIIGEVADPVWAKDAKNLQVGLGLVVDMTALDEQVGAPTSVPQQRATPLSTHP